MEQEFRGNVNYYVATLEYQKLVTIADFLLNISGSAFYMKYNKV